MYYRAWPGGKLKPVDLDETQAGAVYIIGGKGRKGEPCLREQEETLLAEPGTVVLGVDGVPEWYAVHYWWTDKNPVMYDDAVLRDGKITKILRLDYQAERTKSGALICEMPNTLFCGLRRGDIPDRVTSRDRDLSEAHTNLGVVIDSPAIQLAYRLGFKRIYLLGYSSELTEIAMMRVVLERRGVRLRTVVESVKSEGEVDVGMVQEEEERHYQNPMVEELRHCREVGEKTATIGDLLENAVPKQLPPVEAEDRGWVERVKGEKK